MNKVSIQAIILSICCFTLLSVSSANANNYKDEIKLKNTYTNEEHGFSFRYPEGWSKLVFQDELVTIMAKNDSTFPVAMEIRCQTTDEPLPDTMESLEEVYLDSFEGFKAESLEDTNIGNWKGKKLMGTMDLEGQRARFIQYFCKDQEKLYLITCIMLDIQSEKYGPVFEDIIKSYKNTNK